MEFAEIKKLIAANSRRYVKKHGIEVTSEHLLLKLMEETGEFAEALSIYTGQCRLSKLCDEDQAKENLQSELGDVFSTVMVIASHFDIDLLKALEEKVFEKGRLYLEESK